MKKVLLYLFVLLISTLNLYGQDRVAYDFSLVDIDTKENVNFGEVFDRYNLDKRLLTILITWSNEWCGTTCTKEINRYALCDPSIVNLIIVNVDRINDTNSSSYETFDDLQKVLIESSGIWQKAACFYGLTDSGGIEKLVDVGKTPILVVFDPNLNVLVEFEHVIYPYRLFIPNNEGDEVVDYVSFLENAPFKDSPEDVVEFISYLLSRGQELTKEDYQKLKQTLLDTKILLEEYEGEKHYYKSYINLKDVFLKINYSLAYCYYQLNMVSASNLALSKAQAWLAQIEGTMDYDYYKERYQYYDTKLKELETQLNNL